MDGWMDGWVDRWVGGVVSATPAVSECLASCLRCRLGDGRRRYWLVHVLSVWTVWTVYDVVGTRMAVSVNVCLSVVCRLSSSVVFNRTATSLKKNTCAIGQAVNINNITTAVCPSVSVNSPLGPLLYVSRAELAE